MVNIRMENGHAEIGFQGTPMDVAMELATAVGGIYRGLCNVNPQDGLEFKEITKILLQENSPAWKQEQDMTMIVIPTEK